MTAQVLVLDNGLWQQKIGFCGDEAPRYIDQTIIGNPKNPAITSSHENRGVFIGESALSIQRYLNLKESLDDQNECSYSDLEKIWHELFYNKMKVNITDFPVFLMLSAYFDESNKISLVETLFESFNIPSMFMESSAVTGLFAEGLVSGAVLDAGYSGTSASLVFEGLLVESEMVKSHFGGRALRERLRTIIDSLVEQADNMLNSGLAALHGARFDFPFYDDIKYQCFENREFELELPDNTKIRLNSEPFNGVKTEFLNSSADVLLSMLKGSKNEYLGELKQSICLQGGASLIKGFDGHIKQYLFKNKVTDVNIIDRSENEKKYSSWIGGSLYASLNTINSLLVSKQDYQEGGAAYVIRRNLL